jgi:hypothetical protein
VGRIDDLDLDLVVPLSWRQTSQVPGLYRLTILKISRRKLIKHVSTVNGAGNLCRLRGLLAGK